MQTSIVGNGSHYHSNLDAFNSSLSLEDGNPYAYVQLPQLQATREAISIVNQDVKITDMDAFTDYNIAVLNSEQVNVNVRGRTALHEMSFPTTIVDYRKTATMQGLNKLNGFTGNVTFNNYLYATDTLLGTTTLNNLTLYPGNNTLPMRSIIIIINQTFVLEEIINDPKSTLLPVDIVGNSSVYDELHLSYFEKAFQSVTLSVTLDIDKALAAAAAGIHVGGF
ncbi:MAG: hypothetical protein ASARMPREDX12_004445 [Alectoria sarmentosa]|nr:MAG: hypothetical protein ASARMPREDX12_004445 [Alectoria sarmentosa]